jgi:hypothetical protein
MTSFDTAKQALISVLQDTIATDPAPHSLIAQATRDAAHAIRRATTMQDIEHALVTRGLIDTPADVASWIQRLLVEVPAR